MITLSQQLLKEKNEGMTEEQSAEKHNLAPIEVRTLIAIARSEGIKRKGK